MLTDEQFAAPPAAYRPVPMWFWNGHIDAKEVRRQVRQFAEGGLGGFQIAARTGLTTPYLSHSWFALIDLACQEAERYGLQVWLADEYPYPSGVTGGELTLRHPEYRAWHMRAASHRVRPGERLECLAPGSVLLCAVAVPLQGDHANWSAAIQLEEYAGVAQPRLVFTEPALGPSNKRTFSYGPQPKLDWTAPADSGAEWQVWLVAAAEIAPFKFFGHYADLCNPAAVRAFLDTTYLRYEGRLSRRTWQNLTGLFLDEAHPPSWSWSLPEAFQRRNGYDLRPQLPALWTDAGPSTPTIRHDYWQTLTELFMASFHKPVAEWCRQHGVQLSLEVDSTRNYVQRYADVGGNDPGHEKVGWDLDTLAASTRPRFRAHPRFPASLAAQVGQRRVLVESNHSIGWTLTLQDMKALADRLAAQGANFFVLHAFFYTVGGLQKWDAPPSQFFQNPYWPHFRLFSDYVGRLSYALSQGQRASPLALVDPITSLWTHGSGAGGSIGAGPDQIAQRIAADWQYLQRELEAAQRPFDTIDPLLVAEGTVEQGVLRVGNAAYRVLILPPLASLEATAWAKIEAFVSAGGTVIACGLLPSEPIEAGSDVGDRVAGRFGRSAEETRQSYLALGSAGSAMDSVLPPDGGGYLFLPTRGSLVDARAAFPLLAVLDRICPPEVTIRPVDGTTAARSFLLAERHEDDRSLYFIVNAGDRESDADVIVRSSACGTNGGVSIEYLDLEDGTRRSLPAAPLAGQERSAARRVRLHFPRYGAHLLAVGPAHAGAPPRPAAVAPALEEVPVALDGWWDCVLEDDNALRFDRFAFFATAGGNSEDSRLSAATESWPVIEPKPLVNTLRDLAQRAEPWPVPVRVETPFGSPAHLRLALPATLWYETTFDVATMPGHAALCLEAAALQGKATLWLNGTRISPAAFAAQPRWDITNRELDVGHLLRPGTNVLQVRVDAAEPTDGLVDALYLLGDFGVRLRKGQVPVVQSLPPSVRWTQFSADGLPYFAGTIRLRATRELRAPATTSATLRFSDEVLMFAGVASLTVNGCSLGTRAWAPYAWTVPAGTLQDGPNTIEVVLATPLAPLLEGKHYHSTRREVVRVEEDAI